MKTAKYDVAVAGAGPAGSAVARAVAGSGASVVLLDKARFPRPKACAGGIPPKAVSLLPVDLEAGIGTRIRVAHLSYRVSDERVCSSTTALGWTVDRAEFDALLAAKAVGAGAVFRDGCEVKGVRRVCDGWDIDAGGDVVHARFLVGADGVASRVARVFGVGRSPLAATIEATVEVPESRRREDEGRVRFDFGYVAAGYAWTFAKSEHWSAGIYSVRPIPGRVLRQRLDAYISHDPWLEGGRVSKIRSWFVPRAVSRRRSLDVDGGLLVGDAAGLADPLTGEGIRPALESAGLAAAALVDALAGGGTRLNGYSESVDRVLRPGFRVARLCASIAFMRDGRFVRGFIRSAFGERAWGRLARGEVSYPGLRWGLGTLVARLPFGPGRRESTEP